jgi:PAS domain S-box-containing protein
MTGTATDDPYRALFNAVRDAIFVADIDSGMIVDANLAAEALCGWSLAELRSRHQTQLHPPDVAQRARQGFENDTRVPGLTAGFVQHKDGHRIPVEIASSHFSGPDGRRMLLGVFRDTTERNVARERLRESEERLKHAERLAHVGNWHWDIKANRITGSEEMFRIFGKPPDFIPTYEDFIRDIIPQDREQIERQTRECFVGKSGYSTEYQIALPNGDLRTINAITEVARDEEGSPVHMFGACQDITEVKKNEAKLVQAQEDLRALTARLVELQELGMKELARELHDDLSQNLAALGMQIEALLPPSAQPSRSLSEQAHEVWRRVTQLARNVHSMSQRLHPAILDELGLKEALTEQCWAFSERTGIPVKFESAGESTWPGPDVSLCFYRVAQEGLHNIAKHAGATNVHMLLSGDEGSCILRIKDDGQGFDPSGAKGKNALGLISMRERVRLVNGNFTIKSEPGKGTTLEISVDLKTN